MHLLHVTPYKITQRRGLPNTVVRELHGVTDLMSSICEHAGPNTGPI